MEQTDHHLIVGKGAQDFARALGFKIEDDLNTEHSRQLWLEWKRRIDPSHYLDPQKRAEASRKVTREMVAEGLIDARHIYGTINCDGINAKGEICGVTTTSGLAWKIPGRVGDSPILGAGLYVDGEIGGAGSTGRGEANLYNLCSYLIVENMRRGMHPKDAGLEACKRIKANTVEKRLLNSKGNPNFGINFYALNAKGDYAGVLCGLHGKGTGDVAVRAAAAGQVGRVGENFEARISEFERQHRRSRRQATAPSPRRGGRPRKVCTRAPALLHRAGGGARKDEPSRGLSARVLISELSRERG
jgi:N4-(beta-N-acetylglucosaminyl)-L-asparaginase